MLYSNKRLFTSIMLGILFSILFASADDAKFDEEKSIASIPLIQPASAHVPGVSLTGVGTATIDGVLSPGEWDRAGQISVFTGAFAGSTFFVMNDANNLYLALEVVDSTLTPGDKMVVRFDNTHDGVNTDGDDGISARQTDLVDTHFLTGRGYGMGDPLQHGTGAAGITGSKNFIEASKPLNSGDSNDFSLSFGDTVGFCLRYFNDGSSSTLSTFPVPPPPSPFSHIGCVGGDAQQSLYGDITITFTELEPIEHVGSKIAFQNNRDGNFQIYVMNTDGTGQTRLTDNPADDYSPAWSPDGIKIVFFSARDDNYNIYVMNTDGTGQTRLTDNPADDYSPAWSPDGTKIAFVSDRDGNTQIYVMNADGTDQTRLADIPGSEYEPDWSPDGTKIAFVSDREGNFDVYVMNADGTGQTRLTDNPADEDFPDWSPDGTKIAFGSDREDNFAIYVMNTDGTGQTRLTDNPGSDHSPAWSPDGTQIAFGTMTVMEIPFFGGLMEVNEDIFVMNADGTDQTRLTYGFEQALQVNDGEFPHSYGPVWLPLPTIVQIQEQPVQVTPEPEPAPEPAPAPETAEEKVPGWIKNNAKWWSEGQIDDNTFVQGIQFMIKEKIINIPDLPEPAPEPAPALAPSYIEQESYSGDCKLRPSGTTCYGFSDGYIWLLSDFKQGFEEIQEDGKNVEVVVGNDARYYHILNTDLVKSIPPITQAAPETAEEKVPDWVRNNAKWWADGQISEDDFVNGIKYLVEKGIIKV